ncbi:MAG: hypothetical protein SFX73_18290 [Kofleriaceae bacterium]|nr:hypothetical protein [Kofleriaceae bacterium]
MNRLSLLACTSLVFAVGCADDIDPEWQLDHDRIVAVRATPPRIVPGERAILDMLVARVGDAPIEVAPLAAQVVSPESLADLVTVNSQGWGVTAPLEERLVAVRQELGIEPGKPVPVTVGVAADASAFPSGAGPFAATKVVWLGESAQNPVIDSMTTINGVAADATPAELVVGKEVEVPLSVPFAPPDQVRWLTSCGTMYDFDLPDAYLKVELEDPTEGDLAVVVRTANGGVAWRVWPIRAE